MNDLSRWVIALLNEGKLDGQQVLAPGLLTQLAAPHTPVPGTSSHYGYGLMSAVDRGVRVFQHSGSRSGYGSLIAMAPEQRVGVIILVNRTGGSLPMTAEKALALLLPLTAKSAEKAPSLALTEAEIDRCTGVFAQGAQGAQRAELLKRDGQLWLKRETQTLAVSKTGEGRFTAGSTAFALVFSADGKAEYFHAGLRSLRRVK